VCETVSWRPSFVGQGELMSWGGGDFGAFGGGASGGPGGILQGLHICVTGKQSRGTRKEIRAEVLAEGGKFCSDVQQRCTTLIATREEVSKPTRKVSDARGRGIPIVSEAWLQACFDEGGQVDPKDYSIDFPSVAAGGSGARAPVHQWIDDQGGGAKREPSSSPRLPSDAGHRLGGAGQTTIINPREAALLAAERRQQPASVTIAVASDNLLDEDLQLKEAIRQSLELAEAQPDVRARVSLLSSDEEEHAWNEGWEEEQLADEDARATHLVAGDAVRLAEGVPAEDTGPLIRGRIGTIRRVQFEDDDDDEPFQVIVVIGETRKVWWYSSHQLVKVTPPVEANKAAVAPKRQRETPETLSLIDTPSAEAKDAAAKRQRADPEISLIDTDDDDDIGVDGASTLPAVVERAGSTLSAAAAAQPSRMISVDIVRMDLKQLKQELKKRGEKVSGIKIDLQQRLQRSQEARRERPGSTIG
jgi:hypothetical protein